MARFKGERQKYNNVVLLEATVIRIGILTEATSYQQIYEITTRRMAGKTEATLNSIDENSKHPTETTTSSICACLINVAKFASQSRQICVTATNALFTRKMSAKSRWRHVGVRLQAKLHALVIVLTKGW